MFYNIIPLLIILACGLIIVYILARKFPALTNIDLASMPQEKEAKVKQRLIQNRLKRRINRCFFWANKIVLPLANRLSYFSKELYKNLLSLRENYKKESSLAGEGDRRAEEFFMEAEEFIKKEKYEEAEKRYIQAISIDSKNIKSFKLLGELYLLMKKLPEAKETFEHVLKLTEEDADVYANLAEISKTKGDLEKAEGHYLKSIKLNNNKSQGYCDLAEVYQMMNNTREALGCIKKALETEPNNPKYLDIMINLSIIAKEKADAWEAYKKLKEINPENKKLPEIKKKIDEL